ncbi:MAG TPA: monovalent cation/H+ antiporter complex subunit F [Hyphomonadaceae bacterium]|jgi:multicomponent Na+:H+ antiporter subunit F|nr:monovalent cation/H+ antiporter complex subunit F [Hyphomonadaceae bacterium]
MLLIAAAAGLLIAMAMMIARALLGPSHYDRILAANSFGTKTVLLIAVIGFAFGRPAFLDIAIAYALINFVTTIALMKVFRYRSLQSPLSEAGGGSHAGSFFAAKKGQNPGGPGQ